MQSSFNSIYTGLLNTNQVSVLQQHFIGWFIKSDDCFNPARATFMDFQLLKRKRFMYVPTRLHRSFTRIHLVFMTFGEAEYETAIKDTSVRITNYS
jgi:hypothetical protein